jgi:hypothetical protein
MNDNQLCRDVTFDAQTRGLIELEDNLALFILQSYSDSDLDGNMGWAVSGAAQSTISTAPRQRRRWYLFAATQTTGERNIPDMIGSHLL